MATIDIDTETGQIKMPMRRASGIEEVRVRAWVEMSTMLGEWVTDTTSGLDVQAIFDGADDETIRRDVATRLATIENVDRSPEVTIERTTDDDGLNVLTISAQVFAFNEVITVSTGTAL